MTEVALTLVFVVVFLLVFPHVDRFDQERWKARHRDEEDR